MLKTEKTYLAPCSHEDRKSSNMFCSRTMRPINSGANLKLALPSLQKVIKNTEWKTMGWHFSDSRDISKPWRQNAGQTLKSQFNSCDRKQEPRTTECVRYNAGNPYHASSKKTGKKSAEGLDKAIDNPARSYLALRVAKNWLIQQQQGIGRGQLLPYILRSSQSWEKPYLKGQST